MTCKHKLNHPTTPDSTQKTRAEHQKMKWFSRKSIAVPGVKKMQCTCVERGVQKCYQNSYSANIIRIDRLYIYRVGLL